MNKRLRGIYTNSNPIDTPDGYYLDGKNIIIDESVGAITNEKGTILKDNLPSDHTVIGKILLDNDQIVIFSTSGTSHQISLFDGESLSVILNNSILNFNTNHNIEGDFYVDRFGDRVIVWVDGKNPARYLNINNLPSSISSEVLSLFPSISTFPKVNVTSVSESGGSLKSGVYYIAIAYKHEDETLTNFYDVVGPIPITDSNPSDSASFRGTEGIGTSKAINLSFSNTDKNYRSIQLAVIPRYDGVFDAVQLLPEIDIERTSYVYTGYESFSPGALEEIQIDQAFYNSPAALQIYEDSVYLGNMEDSRDIGYQKYANNINVKSTIKTLNGATNGDHDLKNSYKDPINAIYNSGFKRGEVYALYISWILKEGGETKAYHIPGRSALEEDGDVVGGDTFAQGSVFVDADQLADFYNNIDENESPSFNTFSTTSGNEQFSFTWNVNPNQSYPTLSVSYKSESVNVQLPVTDLLPFFEIEFSGTATDDFNIRVQHIGFNDTNYSDILIENGDQADVIAGKIADRINGDSQLTYTANPTGSGSLVITSKSIENRSFHSITFAKDFFADFGSYFGVTVNNQNPSFNNTYVINAVNKIINDINSSSLQLNASVQTDLNIRLVSTIEGESGNDSVDFSSSTSFINPSSLTLSGGGSGVAIDKFIGYQDPVTGMAYWENGNETYPDSEDWDIVDSTGNVLDSLRNQNVRHHRFPEIEDEPLVQNNTDYRVLGFKLENVQIPQEIENQVCGYKIYYADRSFEKRILDQGINIKARFRDNLLRAQHKSQSNPANGSNADRVYFMHPFHLMHDKKDISPLTHIKLVGKINETYETLSTLSYNQSDRIFHTNIEPVQEEPIRRVNAKTYADSMDETGAIDILGQGFPNNIDNNRGESKIIVKIDEELSELNNQGGNAYYLCDLISSKSNMYVSFDSQILVSTNYVHTNMNSLHSDDIFGGDTYINTYTFRANKRHDDTSYVSLHTIICESYDNINYRESGENIWENFYPNDTLVRVGALGWRESNGLSPTPGWGGSLPSGMTPEVFTYDNYFEYSGNISSLNNLRFTEINPKFGRKVEKYPTRVIRSKTDTSKVVRNFLQDDYIDLSTKRGKLIKLSTYNNILIPHMKRSIIRTRGREELQTGDIRAFLGSGNIFSVKPEEIIYTDDGFGGISHKDHSASTPFGYYFYDQDSNRFYALTNEGLQDLTEPILKDIRDKNIQSCIIGYDPYYERILFTINNETLSYSPKIQGWVSYHDYIPNFYFHTKKRCFSSLSTGIYEHNKGNRCEFYGNIYDMSFTYSDNKENHVSKVAMSLQLNTDVFDEEEYKRLKTFNEFRIYNSWQDTGVIPIAYFADEPNNPYIGNVRKTQNKWLINQFRDISNIPQGTSVSDQWKYKKQLDDHYNVVELIKDNTNNEKILLFGVDLMYKNSIR